jgi:3-hydroxyacyl-CoA dehydrogenase
MIMGGEIKKAACVGGGVIGSSWAALFAMKGIAVTLYDINDEQLEKSKKGAQAHLDSLAGYGVITTEQKEDIEGRIGFTTSIEEAVKDAGFIQESGPERIEIKRKILWEVDRYAKPDALYASSTSGLLISEIVKESPYPGRCVGAHPYNPPHLIPLVEITKGGFTDDTTVSAVCDFYQSIGKEPVVLRKECPGFLANRLQLALYREVQDLVIRGVCSVEDIDKALVYGPGLRWGIFGHNMIMQLGNPGGLTGMVKMLGNAGDQWLADMANWTHQPENWSEIAQPGVDEEMKNFPDHIGHSNEQCAAYRDKMLIELLKLHHKL